MSHTYELLQCTHRHTIIMQCISYEYDTLNLCACNYTGIFHEAAHHRAATSHCTPLLQKNTDLHHGKAPFLGCDVKAAHAVVVREEEEVAAALLDEQLW
jgi:hypothetical protein